MQTTIAKQIPANSFHFDEKNREFHADISELEHAGHDPFMQLYADQGDKGFVMKLAGFPVGLSTVEFKLINTSRDGEQEIRYWVFALVPGLYPTALHGVQVVILND